LISVNAGQASPLYLHGMAASEQMLTRLNRLAADLESRIAEERSGPQQPPSPMGRAARTEVFGMLVKTLDALKSRIAGLQPQHQR
jgi:hypothetical protein